jgi:hypothetical protein
MSGTSNPAQQFRVVTPAANRVQGSGSLQTLELYAADGSALAIPRKQAAQADSNAGTATTASLAADLNSLLAKLRLAGIIS